MLRSMFSFQIFSCFSSSHFISYLSKSLHLSPLLFILILTSSFLSIFQFFYPPCPPHLNRFLLLSSPRIPLPEQAKDGGKFCATVRDSSVKCIPPQSPDPRATVYGWYGEEQCVEVTLLPSTTVCPPPPPPPPIPNRISLRLPIVPPSLPLDLALALLPPFSIPLANSPLASSRRPSPLFSSQMFSGHCRGAEPELDRKLCPDCRQAT